MTNHEGDVPAMPCDVAPANADQICSGFSQRQRAAIDLRWPDSGTPWIDSMIRKSLRAEFAKAAMQGMVAHPDSDICPADRIAEDATEVADYLLAALEKGR